MCVWVWVWVCVLCVVCVCLQMFRSAQRPRAMLRSVLKSIRKCLEGSVEAVWGLPARLGPTDPRWLPGGSLEPVWGPSAQFGAHRAPGGFQKPLWRPFGASRPGWGPLPGASVDTTWGHLARLEPTGPQMASRRLCGAFVDFPGLAMSISQSSLKSRTHTHIQTYRQIYTFTYTDTQTHANRHANMPTCINTYIHT